MISISAQHTFIDQMNSIMSANTALIKQKFLFEFIGRGASKTVLVERTERKVHHDLSEKLSAHLPVKEYNGEVKVYLYYTDEVKILIYYGRFFKGFCQEIKKYNLFAKRIEDAILQEQYLFDKNGVVINRKMFFEDTQTVSIESNYLNGAQHGKSTLYYNDDVLKSVCNYDYNQYHGDFIDYNPDGTIRDFKQFNHGKKHGAHIRYDLEGKQIEAHYYRDDEEISEIDYKLESLIEIL